MEKKHSAILETLADEIRLIYQSDCQRAGTLIETYLGQRLNEYLPDEKMAMLEELAARFEPVAQNQDHCVTAASEDLLQLYSMLLGRKIVDADLTSSEITKSLGMSLNTIFDSINTIIAVIRTTLLGEKTELQTIREIIDSHLGREGGCETLKSYLDQIKDAFLLAHRAFQETARIKIAQMLDELSPDRIAESMDRSLKFGPLYKAELYDQYKKRYLECKKWFESDRFTRELLREFENICQRSYKNGMREIS